MWPFVPVRHRRIMNICKTFPCPRCGFFRGQGGILCSQCGRDPDASFVPLPVPNRVYTFRDSYRESVNLLVLMPIMVFIAYPIGYLALKLASFGRLELGSWQSFGEPRLPPHLRESRAPKRKGSVIRAETVATIGASLVFFGFLLAQVISQAI